MSTRLDRLVLIKIDSSSPAPRFDATRAPTGLRHDAEEASDQHHNQGASQSGSRSRKEADRAGFAGVADVGVAGVARHTFARGSAVQIMQTDRVDFRSRANRNTSAGPRPLRPLSDKMNWPPTAGVPTCRPCLLEDLR